jgi:hypothetical protein
MLGTEICIPYVLDAHGGLDLRYALRSWEHNWKGLFRITLVGEKPPGLNELWLVPHQKAVSNHFPRALDAVEKVKLMCTAGYMRNDRFIYSYDDIYLLRPADEADVDRRIGLREISRDEAFGTVPSVYAKGKHGRLVLQTARRLFERGHVRVWNYETHIPRFYERRKMLDVIDVYKPGENRLLLSTLYFNHFYPDQEPVLMNPMDNIKAGFYGKVNDPRSLPPYRGNERDAMAHYRRQLTGKLWLNHNDLGLDVGLQHLRHTLWPEPSCFESQPPAPPVKREQMRAHK